MTEETEQPKKGKVRRILTIGIIILAIICYYYYFGMPDALGCALIAPCRVIEDHVSYYTIECTKTNADGIVLNTPQTVMKNTYESMKSRGLIC